MSNWSSLPSEFWRYRVGQFVSAFGSNCGRIALMLWLLGSYSTSTVANLVAVIIFVQSSIGIYFGAVVDRGSLRRYACIGELTCSASWILLALVASFYQHPPIFAVIALVVMDAVGAALFGVTVFPAINRLVDKGNLEKAFSAVYALDALGLVLGGLGGAWIVNQLGTTTAFCVNAVTFVCSFAIIYSIKKLNIAKERGAQVLSSWQQIKAATAYIYTKREILVFVGIAIMFASIIAPVQIIFPLLAKSSLINDAWLLGLIQATLAAGVVSSSFFSRYAQRWGDHLMISFLLCGAALILLAYLRNYEMLFCVFIYGVARTSVQVKVQAKLTGIVPTDFQSRVFSQLGFLEGTIEPMSLAVAGYGIAWIGISPILVTLAVLIAVPVCMVMIGNKSGVPIR